MYKKIGGKSTIKKAQLELYNNLTDKKFKKSIKFKVTNCDLKFGKHYASLKL